MSYMEATGTHGVDPELSDHRTVLHPTYKLINYSILYLLDSENVQLSLANLSFTSIFFFPSKVGSHCVAQVRLELMPYAPKPDLTNLF